MLLPTLWGSFGGLFGTGDAPFFLGLLCGVGIPLAVLLVEPYKRNRNLRFHAFQGLFVSGLIIVYNIVYRILSRSMLTGMTSMTALEILLWVYTALPLILAGLLTLKTFKNQRWVLPILGPIAEQQANK
jgi:uncharacterized membrane protein